jgi:HlyD family secretion protein
MSGIAVKLKGLWAGSIFGRSLLVAPPVALIVVALLYYGVGSHPAVQFYSAKVEKGDISQVVQATGTINAVVSVQVGSQVSGIIQKLSADFNSVVKKGQIVAQIDPAVFKSQLEQAEADLANSQANVKSLEAQIETQQANVLAAKANIAKAQATVDDSKQIYDRTVDLAKQGILPDQQKDTAKATYDGAVAGLHASEAQFEQAQANLKQAMAQRDQAKAQVQQKAATADMARTNLNYTTIYAPVDGTVIARNVDVGQTVASSFSAPVLFVIAQDLTKMLVYAKTDESDVGKIKVGAQATFRVDSFPRETFHGTVQQVRMNATTIQNVVTYDTIVAFDNPDGKLFPGMTAYVSIPVDWANDAVKIPNGALRFKPDLTDDERKALFAKYNIPDTSAGSRLAGAGKAPGGAGGGQAGGGGAGKAPGGGGGGQGGGGKSPSTTTRDDFGIVYKLLPDKTLQPVRVRLGVTDFTFTACVNCAGAAPNATAGTAAAPATPPGPGAPARTPPDLKVGDDLVIGQTSKTGSQAATAPKPGASPMGGPGGMPRRF